MAAKVTPHFVGRGRLAVVTALFVALLTLLTFAGSAKALDWTYVYSEVLPASTWGGYRTEPDGNGFTLAKYVHADYNGEGTTSVCEQVQSEDGTYLMSSMCANNHVMSGNLQNSFWGWRKRVRIKNNSSFTHTIWGKVRSCNTECSF